ncbi:MAG: D-alanyl-D-alanine carboxypeptidase family protein [Pseudomonadota bacterium]|nr:D-alanyl-D-alanine carboxypeptidase family protein [Pseudomonadota bacterium]
MLFSIRLLAVLFAFVIFAAPAWAVPVQTRAEHAILIDIQTDTVLLEKNADDPMPTASMSKTMTMYMVFDALESGRLSLEDKIRISHNAWTAGQGGSTMFAREGSRVKVEDLIRGVIVQSGNDASVALAEGLRGSEEGFAMAMTARAHEIGAKNSRFVNASGLPDPNHVSTARDMARIAIHLIRDFPQYYHYFSEHSFTYENITQRNRNRLLDLNIGADGVKTGHTEQAGYSIVASAERDGRRLVLVISGMESDAARNEEAARLLEMGFQDFKTCSLFEAGEEVDIAEVWLGTAPLVPLVIDKPLFLTLSRTQRRDMKVTISLEEPVAAPIRKGSPVAELTVIAPDMTPVTRVLVAGKSVPEVAVHLRLFEALKQMLLGAH